MDKPVRPAAQTEQHYEGTSLGNYVGEKVVRASITEVESDDSWSSEEDNETVTRNRLTPLEEVAPAEESGLSHFWRTGGRDRGEGQPTRGCWCLDRANIQRGGKAGSKGRKRAPDSESSEGPDTEMNRRAHGHTSPASALV